MKASSIRLAVGLLFVLAGFSACGKDRKFDDAPLAEAGAASTGGTGGSGSGVGAGGGYGDGDCTFGAVRCDGLTPQTCSEDGAWVTSQASCAVACFQRRVRQLHRGRDDLQGRRGPEVRRRQLGHRQGL